MKLTSFEYRVEGEIELSGREIALLKTCADYHYDLKVRRMFAHHQFDSFGTGWLTDFAFNGMGDVIKLSDDLPNWQEKALDEHPERTVKVRVNGTEIGRCLKALEMTPPLAKGAEYEEYVRLAQTFRQALDAMHQERLRLDENRPSPPHP